MTDRTRLQLTLDALSAALLDRLETAESLAIRTLPTSRVSAARHVASLRRAVEESASLVASIEVLLGDDSAGGVKQRSRK